MLSTFWPLYFPLFKSIQLEQAFFQEYLHLGTKICSQPIFQCLNSRLRWRPSVMNPCNGLFQQPSSSFSKPILYKLVALCSRNTVHSPISPWVTEVIHQLCRNNHQKHPGLTSCQVITAFCLLTQFQRPCERHWAPGRVRSCILSDHILGSSWWGWALAPRVEWHGEGLKWETFLGLLPAPRQDSSELQGIALGGFCSSQFVVMSGKEWWLWMGLGFLRGMIKPD